MATPVEQFNELVPQLIKEAAAYAAAGEQNPEVEAAIRQLRTLTGALQGALSTIIQMPRP